jgi:4-carboxymuconolactone decarboxylase
MNAYRLFCRATVVSLLCVVPLAANAQPAPPLPADINATSLARLPYLQRKDTDDSAKRLFDIFVRKPQPSPTDTLSGPLAFAAYNVPVATALLDLHDGAVGKSTISAHVRELAILVACRATNYHLEWNGHESAALKAGVDAKVIDLVRRNAALTSDVSAADAAVINFGRQVLNNRKLDSATFAKAVELFGQHGAMDLVAVMSTYAVSGFFAIAVDEHMPAGQATLP